MRKEEEKAVSLETTNFSPGDLSSEQVLEFLQHNPDFLAENAQTIAETAPPTRWSGDGVAVETVQRWTDCRADLRCRQKGVACTPGIGAHIHS